jgi:hypothetical protein
MEKRYKRAMARSKLRKSQESVKREAKELEVSFLKEDLVRELRESVHNLPPFLLSSGSCSVRPTESGGFVAGTHCIRASRGKR